MASRGLPQPERLEPGVRLTAPVLGPTGGGGRSVVAGLLADALAPHGETVLLDAAPRLISPWPTWAATAGEGLAGLPPDRPASQAQARAAAAAAAASGPHPWHVMTDHLPWHTAPLALPEAPEAWYQLAALGAWQAAVADTAHPFTHDVMASRHTGTQGLSARWCSLPCAVPVLSAPATGQGMAALQTAVLAAEAEGLPLARTTVALVATSDGRLPASVKAGATMLQPKIGALVHVPYDERIRSHGLRDASRLKPRTLAAGRQLAQAVLFSAHRSWGETLPHAAVPAAYTEGTTHRGLAPQAADHPC
ncbi:hypothetical protein M1P56_35290 (plasmid) [Streptomyces sp. HU2014]|uniref:hypothetical protein n=1 Tax=Streptomyces sp. HU2014 TaxID=2939414 RepID=UPI00200BA4AE|nr:hypothetical protein [Streptomyces sp. HU2014]UQI49658.1 hypothetical protein M1P56_35290 [Streptomyces sp. HU2014]